MPDTDTNPSAASPRQSASGLQAACINRLFFDDAGLSRRAEGPPHLLGRRIRTAQRVPNPALRNSLGKRRLGKLTSVKLFHSLCSSALCAVAIAAPTIAAPSAPAPRPADRAAIQDAYGGLDDAFSRHDLPRFMSYFTDDYIDIDEKGTRLTKEQTRRGYQDQLGQMKTNQSHYVIQNLAPAPGGTLVEMRMHSSGLGEKRILFAKLHGTFTDDLWVRDLWVNTPQGWRIQHRQTLKDELHIRPR